MEEHLYEFKPSPTPPGLKERILAAARSAPRPRLIDRLWNRRTLGAVAAGALASFGLYALSLQPIRVDLSIAQRDLDRSKRLATQIVDSWRVDGVRRVMVARLAGPNELLPEDVR
jgi:hypothetical protein